MHRAVKSGACIAEAEIHHGCVIGQNAQKCDIARQTEEHDSNYDHVKPMIDALPASLTALQREQAVELIR